MTNLPRRSTTYLPKPGGSRSNSVRLIGGRFRRAKLPVANKPGLRPTPDRVRETLFNWLGQDLTGWVCLDAFAGTGALGLEAASRGAGQVLLVEVDKDLATQLRRLAEQLGATAVRVQHGDGVGALSRAMPDSLDLIFLDPPFDAGLFESALSAARRALQPSGFVYLESPQTWADEQLAGLGYQVWRYLRAGAVHAYLLERLSDGGAGSAESLEG